MDTLPLPPRPDLDQYRKRAKASSPPPTPVTLDAAKQWADDWLRAPHEVARRRDHALRAAQFRPRCRGHPEGSRCSPHPREGRGWCLCARGRSAPHRAGSQPCRAGPTSRRRSKASVLTGKSDFERAADAVVEEDLAVLNELLEKDSASPARIRREAITPRSCITSPPTVSRTSAEDAA